MAGSVAIYPLTVVTRLALTRHSDTAKARFPPADCLPYAAWRESLRSFESARQTQPVCVLPDTLAYGVPRLVLTAVAAEPEAAKGTDVLFNPLGTQQMNVMSFA